MEKLLLLSLAFASGGCIFSSHDTVGHWEGTCQIDSLGVAYDFEMDFDIDSDEKKEIEGVVWFDVTGGYAEPQEFDLMGTRKGKDVAFSIDVDQDLVPVTFSVEAVIKGDTMDGDCVLGASGIGVRGELELDRI